MSEATNLIDGIVGLLKDAKSKITKVEASGHPALDAGIFHVNTDNLVPAVAQVREFVARLESQVANMGTNFQAAIDHGVIPDPDSDTQPETAPAPVEASAAADTPPAGTEPVAEA